MTRKSLWIGLTLAALAGCESPTPDAAPAAPGGEPAATTPAGAPDQVPSATPATEESAPAAPATEMPKEGGEPKAASTEGFSAEELAEIKKLPTDEQPIALAQKTCPVSGENLGMDVPIKKVVDGKTVFLCCKGCVKDFDADPSKFVADKK
jgi:hypothetical protein